ncbi:helix-turn-helix domain-containing protein [Gordonia sp. DT30]|uniref:AraC family transcriptional regulator n=1 Tax=Gordonia sp. DT30 TaxID=3416546 RepID=UPI003CF1105E
MERDTVGRGLPPELVRSWLARIGADDPLGANPTRYIRRSGRQGLANYIPALAITTDEPDAFDEIAFWRPLTEMLVYALIRTPCTMSRTPSIIEEHPSRHVVVGTQSMPGDGVFTQGGHTYSYRAPACLVVFDNNVPFQQTSREVADLAGIWIPNELLGSEFADRRITPVCASTPLARAASAFIRNFALDVAARGADVDPDTELAAIDLVRAILTQGQPDRAHDRALNDPGYVREATRSLIDHHFRDPEFTAESIARILHMSRRHLYRYFRDTDVTPATMIATRRLERARELLIHRENAGLDSIALACGFTSAATLRNRFRAEYGMTPNEFRRRSAGHRSSWGDRVGARPDDRGSR